MDCRKAGLLKHKTIYRLFKRCYERPAPGPRCEEPKKDVSLGVHEPTEHRGRCQRCRDSGISLEDEVEVEDVRSPHYQTLVRPWC